jgi:N-ethylmaleimide reductase
MTKKQKKENRNQQHEFELMNNATQVLPSGSSPAVLFESGRLGAIQTKNRIVMAPMTRSRAGRDGVPATFASKYYRARADAGLIISEMTQISPQGQGYAFTPGIHSDAQIEGWRGITSTVHAAGGKMLLQLGHVGRISHPSLQPVGALPVAPSAVRPNLDAFTYDGFVPMVEPRALEREEIAQIVRDFGAAARNAVAAGFDGVELHAANGYIFEQFFRDKTNRRTDSYGGSIENRLRFLFEVVDTATEAIGPDRLGVRLSPFHLSNDVSDSDPAPLFLEAAHGLGERKIAFLESIVDLPRFPPEAKDQRAAATLTVKELREAFGGTFIANGGFDGDSAAAAVASGATDFVSFGRPFLADSELVQRISRSEQPNTELDRKYWYGGDHIGYSEIPEM